MQEKEHFSHFSQKAQENSANIDFTFGGVPAAGTGAATTNGSPPTSALFTQQVGGSSSSTSCLQSLGLGSGSNQNYTPKLKDQFPKEAGENLQNQKKSNGTPQVDSQLLFEFFLL